MSFFQIAKLWGSYEEWGGAWSHASATGLGAPSGSKDTPPVLACGRFPTPYLDLSVEADLEEILRLLPGNLNP